MDLGAGWQRPPSPSPLMQTSDAAHALGLLPAQAQQGVPDPSLGFGACAPLENDCCAPPLRT